jgi:hypothetical protein
MKDKNMALHDFRRMIELSWTYEKMTEKEQDSWNDVLNNCRTIESLKGDYHTRWNILQAIYNAYLIGIGYDGFQWREVE